MGLAFAVTWRARFESGRFISFYLFKKKRKNCLLPKCLCKLVLQRLFLKIFLCLKKKHVILWFFCKNVTVNLCVINRRLYTIIPLEYFCNKCKKTLFNPSVVIPKKFTQFSKNIFDKKVRENGLRLPRWRSSPVKSPSSSASPTSRQWWWWPAGAVAGSCSPHQTWSIITTSWTPLPMWRWCRVSFYTNWKKKQAFT